MKRLGVVLGLLAMLATSGCVAVYSGVAVSGAGFGYAQAKPEHEARDTAAGAAIALACVGGLHILFWSAFGLGKVAGEGLGKALYKEHDEDEDNHVSDNAAKLHRRFGQRRLVRP